VRSSLHLSPLSPLKVKGGRRRRWKKRRGKLGNFWIAQYPLRAGFFTFSFFVVAVC